MRGHLIAARGTREKPPKRRTNTRTELLLRDTQTGARQRIYVDVGRYQDGRVAETFVTVANVGTYLKTVFEAWAMLASLALQHGLPPSKLAQSIAGLQTGTYLVSEGPPAIVDQTVTSIWGAIALVLTAGGSGLR